MIIRSIDAIIRMLDADYIENADIEEKIQGVCIDSRKVVEGNLTYRFMESTTTGTTMCSRPLITAQKLCCGNAGSKPAQSCRRNSGG